LVLATVLTTALAIHLVWSRSARENVADVARQLNGEIVGSIRHELRGVLDQAVAAQQAVGSIFANGTIAPEDEAKRDFIFLALLRSQPSLSWVSLGTPEGAFFGAQRVGEGKFNLVSVSKNPTTGAAEERTFRFEAKGLEMVFLDNQSRASSYDATHEDWYRRAVSENGPGWNHASRFPGAERAGISTSTPLMINTQFRGVVNVVIELERLSRFLAGLTVSKTGTVVVVDPAGHIVASTDPRAIAQQQQGQMPMLDELGAGNPLLALVGHTISGMAVDLPAVTSTRQLEVTSPADGQSYYITFEPLQFQSWVVATVIPARDFLASIERNARILVLALVVLTLAMAGLSIWLINRLVARPLGRIVGQLKFIESFRLDQVQHIGSWLREFDGLSQALVQMSRGLASFQRYMPTELVRTLVSRGVEARPGGSQEYLTVMFADLAGFTSLSEMLGEAVVPVLTEYLETSSSAVITHRGTIDKFIGDAVMAFWGAPIENPAHARDACAAALACVDNMATRRAALPAGDPRRDLRVRIGINTGRMLVGNVGSAERLNYTVIGDPVNVASRLESLNKRYGTAVIIGEATRRAADDAIQVRALDWVAVYGRAEGIAVYELLAMAEAGDPARFAWVKDYEAGLAAYRARRWEEAVHLFTAANAARDRGDRPSQIFIERCRALLANPPGADWTPVAVLMEK
ncbi:MAG TPA: adenylate/guanylate cyclase domain-containing protein, partial [Dongiaceae bacterium]|nr:adenylate/guanylate cyclase domain-containing protein [Dongiaceae bacterium]